MGELKEGDRVDVLSRALNWARVRSSTGLTGWVEEKGLLDAGSYEAGQKLLTELGKLPAQSVGHTSAGVNLRTEPSRDAPPLARLNERARVEVFGRRLVERPAQPDERIPSSPGKEAWYLVRAGSRGGWVLGRLVALDVPEALSMYAQDVNLVAWLVLMTVEDEGRQVPHYLVADRIGTQEYDFNHIRVFTWWSKKHEYATAYVEGNLRGFFPIRVETIDGVPYFRLRLTDERGQKFQKVYGLFNTITRPVGRVDGWESDAVPTRRPMKRRQRR